MADDGFPVTAMSDDGIDLAAVNAVVDRMLANPAARALLIKAAVLSGAYDDDYWEEGDDDFG
jgi:hypothetical protein